MLVRTPNPAMAMRSFRGLREKAATSCEAPTATRDQATMISTVMVNVTGLNSVNRPKIKKWRQKPSCRSIFSCDFLEVERALKCN